MKLRGVDFTGLAYLAALAALAYGVYRLAKAGPDVAKKTGDAVTAALDAINPANPNNLVNQGANRLFRDVTGNQVDTIGTAARGFYESIFRPSTAPLRAQLGTVEGDDAELGDFMTRAQLTAQWSDTSRASQAAQGLAGPAGTVFP